ncbi:MAG: pitrilysin family protein [Phycisphaerales bacterium]|jgi:predicted Zn-dependent peptidase|nr:pitrilysin family protein [Phycisphaerales bacterium]
MPVQYHEHALPNGLRMVAEVDPEAASAAAGFFVRSGARDEPSDLMGISHFLEHMVFKGTASRSGEEIDECFDALGTRHNAWTSHEITAFHIHGVPGVLQPALEILADIMRPALRPEDLDDEREVVIEEIAMYEDQPFWQLWEAASAAYFGDHPMGHRVLGRVDTVRAIDADAMRSWHDARYGADNVVLALAGDVDFDAVASDVAGWCGDWRPTGAERTPHELTHTARELVERSDKINASYVLGISPAPALQDARRHAAAMLAWILGRGDGSRMHWALVDPGHAEEARCEFEAHDRCGQFVSWAVCPADSVDAVESIMRQTHEELVDSVTEDDLIMARSMIRTAVTLHSELPAGRMQRLGRMVTTVGHHVPLEEELELINAVGLDDLRAVAEDWPLQPLVVGRLLPD